MSNSVGHEMDAEMFRWDGEFKSRDIEDEFVSATWGETIARNRAIVLAAFIFVAAGAIDYLSLGLTQAFVQLFALRVFTLLVAFAPVVFFAEGRDKSSYYAAVSFAQCYLFAVLVLAAAAGTSGSRDLAVAAIVILFTYYIAVPNRLLFNTIVGLVSSALLLCAMYLAMDVSSYGLGIMVALSTVTNVVGIKLGGMSGKLRRTEYLSMVHHKSMAGQLASEIAERRVAETEARASERSFESVFRAAPLPLALIRPGETKFVLANKSACELFGVEPKKIKSLDLKMLIASGLSNHTLEELIEVMGTLEPVDISIGTPDGRKLWVNFTASAMRYRGAPAILIALHDVTIGRREKEQLRLARDLANNANKSKTEFLANMSHELRTPLNAIIGFSEALSREIFGPLGTAKYHEYAQDIHSSGVHLLNIINDILDLSKIEAGKFDLGDDEVELRFLIEGVMRLVASRADLANVRLECRLDDDEIAIRCDERALKQILINLLANAVKFSRTGTCVSVSVEERQDMLRITVADQGIGMAPEDIPLALEPFRQVDGTLTRNYEGTGLGLPLARRLTELHGGTLSIESAHGVGTSVFVDLPIQRLLTPLVSPRQKTTGEIAKVS